MTNNYFSYWAKRFIRDGLKAIKIVLGLGLSILLFSVVNKIIGVLFFLWVLSDALIQKN